MFTVLGGKSDALGLPALLKVVSELRESGSFRVSHPNWEGQLFFEAGRVVGASLVTRQGTSVAEALVQALPAASFTYERATPAPGPAVVARDAGPRPPERVRRHRAALAVLVVLVALAGLLLALRPISGPRVAPSMSAPVQEEPGTLVDERFVDNARGWPNDPQGPAWLSDGGYQITTRRPGQFVALGAPLPDVLSDVAVSATFHKVSGPSGAAYGIIVRDQGPGPRDGANQAGRYYLLAVNDRREAGMFRREGDRWIDLLPWRAIDAARSGNQSNELSVRAVGDRLTLAVNAIDVANQTDGALGAGHVGVFIGGDRSQVALERFAVRTP